MDERLRRRISVGVLGRKTPEDDLQLFDAPFDPHQ